MSKYLETVPDAPDASHTHGKQEKPVNQLENQQPLGRVAKSSGFFQGSMDVIGKNLVNDILIPAARDTLFNLGNSFLSSFIYGSGAPSRDIIGGAMRTMRGTAYSDYSSVSRYGRFGQTQYPGPVAEQANRTVYDYVNVEFDSYGLAELALERLRDIIEQQGFCRVSDLYSVATNIVPTSTDNNWGWFELPPEIVKVRQKFNGKYKITFTQVKDIRSYM